MTLRLFLLIFPPPCVGRAVAPSVPLGVPIPVPLKEALGRGRSALTPSPAPGPGKVSLWGLVLCGRQSGLHHWGPCLPCRAHRGPWRWGQPSVLFPSKYGARGVGCCPGSRVEVRVGGSRVLECLQQVPCPAGALPSPCSERSLGPLPL